MKDFIGKVRKLYLLHKSDFLRKAYWKSGIVASVEHQAALSSIDCVDLVVDIGANRGQFSLLSRSLFPEATIIAFEPLQEPSETFRSLFAGDSRVHIHRVAIGPHRTSSLMHISARDHSSSLLPIGALQVESFSGTAEVGTTNVMVSPLSSFLQPEHFVDRSLLKIDVQGYEYQALLGCEALVEKFTYIYCECSFVELYLGQLLFSDVASWLFARGFAVSGIYNVHYNLKGVAIQADILFSRHHCFGNTVPNT